VPYGIEFRHPVVKLMCGDLFAGLLTAQGEVFTWGWNIFGQLGMQDTSIGVTLNATKITFPNKADKIVDIACGFNHSMALTDSKQVYVWGKRMGIYPQYEFNLLGIEQTTPDQMRVIN
jgi:alpha-tubulin suppressor-like RCC1 family protein